MNLVKLIEFLRNRLKTVTLICIAVLVLLAAADMLFVGKEEAHTWAEKHFPAFWSIFGFVGCAVIIIVSKWFGHAGIMTREDYYDE
jgi:hypothetical protein